MPNQHSTNFLCTTGYSFPHSPTDPDRTAYLALEGHFYLRSNGHGMDGLIFGFRDSNLGPFEYERVTDRNVHLNGCNTAESVMMRPYYSCSRSDSVDADGS